MIAGAPGTSHKRVSRTPNGVSARRRTWPMTPSGDHAVRPAYRAKQTTADKAAAPTAADTRVRRTTVAIATPATMKSNHSTLTIPSTPMLPDHEDHAASGRRAARCHVDGSPGWKMGSGTPTLPKHTERASQRTVVPTIVNPTIATQ